MTQQERKKKDQLTRLLSLPPSFLPIRQLQSQLLKRGGKCIEWHGMAAY